MSTSSTHWTPLQVSPPPPCLNCVKWLQRAQTGPISSGWWGPLGEHVISSIAQPRHLPPRWQIHVTALCVQETWTPYSPLPPRHTHTLWCSGKTLSPFLGLSFLTCTTKTSCGTPSVLQVSYQNWLSAASLQACKQRKSGHFLGTPCPSHARKDPHLLPEMSYHIPLHFTKHLASVRAF